MTNELKPIESAPVNRQILGVYLGVYPYEKTPLCLTVIKMEDGKYMDLISKCEARKPTHWTELPEVVDE